MFTSAQQQRCVPTLNTNKRERGHALWVFSNTQWARAQYGEFGAYTDPLLPGTPSLRLPYAAPTRVRSVYPSTLEDAHTQRTRYKIQMQIKSKISDPRRLMIQVKVYSVIQCIKCCGVCQLKWICPYLGLNLNATTITRMMNLIFTIREYILWNITITIHVFFQKACFFKFTCQSCRLYFWEDSCLVCIRWKFQDC